MDPEPGGLLEKILFKSLRFPLEPKGWQDLKTIKLGADPTTSKEEMGRFLHYRYLKRILQKQVT